MSPRPGRVTDVIESDLPKERPLDIRETPEFLTIAHRVRMVFGLDTHTMSSGGKTIPVLTVIACIVAIWYASVIWMNAPFERDQAERAGKTIAFSELVKNTMAQKRPVLPAPHQVVTEIYKTTVQKKIHLQALADLSCVDHIIGDLDGICHWHRTWHLPGGWHRAQPGHGQIRDALGDHISNDSHPCHRPDDYCRPECHGHIRIAA